jgi:hypothetical protein
MNTVKEIQARMDKRTEELQMSSEYADYIMTNATRPICNGDMLTVAMEEGYLFDEFVASLM